MRRRNKFICPLITLLAFMLSACDRQTDVSLVDALKQQQENQQKKINLLEKQQIDLANNTQLIARALVNVDTKLKTLTFTELDPSQTRYFILNNGTIALAGRITSIAPVNDGSVIHISLVNLLSVPLSNIGFQMTWGNKRPVDKKELTHWEQLLFSTQISSAIEFPPGQWKDIDLTLKGVSPNNLKYLKMSINMDSLIFENTTPKKTTVTKTKK